MNDSRRFLTSNQPPLAEVQPTYRTYRPVKRRFLPGHSFFEEGDLFCCSLNKQIPTEIFQECFEDSLNTLPEFKCHETACRELFNSVSSYEVHYNSKHRIVCVNCKRSFPSNYLLDIHILEWHDTLFQLLAKKQNMFRCLLDGCPDRFHSTNQRRKHLVSKHKYPANFRFDRPMKNKQKNSGKEEKMDTCATNNMVKNSKIYSVPKNICFGRGTPRTFQPNRKQQNSGQRQKDTTQNRNVQQMEYNS